MANFPKKIHFKHTFSDVPPQGSTSSFPIQGTDDQVFIDNRTTTYGYGVSTPFEIGKVGSTSLSTFRFHPYVDFYREDAGRFRFFQHDGYLFAIPDIVDGWPYDANAIYIDGDYYQFDITDVYQIDIMNIPITPHTTKYADQWWSQQGLINGVDVLSPYQIPDSGYEEELVPLLKNSNFVNRIVFDPGVDHLNLTTSGTNIYRGAVPTFYSSSKTFPWSNLVENLGDGTPTPVAFGTGLSIPRLNFVTATVEQSTWGSIGSLQAYPEINESGGSYDTTFIRDIFGNTFNTADYDNNNNRIVKYFKIDTINTGPQYKINGVFFGGSSYSSYPSGAGSRTPRSLGWKFSSFNNTRYIDEGYGQVAISDVIYESTASQFEVGDKVKILILQNSGIIFDNFTINDDGQLNYYNPDLSVNALGSYSELIFDGENSNDFEIVFKKISWDKYVGYECEVNTEAPYLGGYITESLVSNVNYQLYEAVNLSISNRNYFNNFMTSTELLSPSVNSKLEKPNSSKSSFSIPYTTVRVDQGTLEPYIGPISSLSSNRFKLKEYEMYGGSASIGGGWKVGSI